MTTRYPLAERFHAPQGEGIHAGVQMAFLRLVGCSVGKGICTNCDTEFDKAYPALGGGLYDPAEILDWVGDDRHVCLTGGEPLDRDLRPLLIALAFDGRKDVHLETSGTVRPDWLDPARPPGRKAPYARLGQGSHVLAVELGGVLGHYDVPLWITVSPKPGYLKSMVEDVADEVKVILRLDKDLGFLGGLGTGPGWPTVEDAVRWADDGKLVYVQPVNAAHEVDGIMLDRVLAIVARHPQLRISPQIHKFMMVR